MLRDSGRRCSWKYGAHVGVLEMSPKLSKGTNEHVEGSQERK